MSKNTFIPTTKGLVSAHKSQDFTSDQKAQARTNIAAAASTHTHSADDIVSGALAKAQQHAQTAYLDAASQVFAGAATFNGLLQINGSSGGASTYLQLLNNSGAIGILGSDASISGGNAADVGLSVYGDNEFCLWTNSTRMIRVNDSGSTFYNAATFNGSLLAGSGSFAVTDDYHLATHASAKIGWTDTGGVTTASTVNMHLARKDSSTVEIRKANGSVGDFSAGSATFNGSVKVSKGDANADSYGNRVDSLVFSRGDLPTSYLNKITNSFSATPSATTMNFELGDGGGSGYVIPLTLRGDGASTFNGQVTAASGIAVSGKIQISNNGSSFGSTLSNGSSQFYNSLTAGLMIAGAGSTSDLLITNKSGGDVFSIPTGTVNADFAGSVSALSLNADVGSNKPLRSYRDASYSGWYNGTSLSSNEAYFMGVSGHYFSVGGVNRLTVENDSQFSGNVLVGGTAKLGDYTVATLPSAASNTGYECNATDSSVTTFGSTVAGGGSSNVKVRSNGTNWTVTGI